MCVVFKCSHGTEIFFKVVSDWLTLVVDLCRTILAGGPLWTQSDDNVVLEVVFFAWLFVVLVSKYLVI